MKVIKGGRETLVQQQRDELRTIFKTDDESTRDAAKERLLALSDRLNTQGNLQVATPPTDDDRT